MAVEVVGGGPWRDSTRSTTPARGECAQGDDGRQMVDVTLVYYSDSLLIARGQLEPSSRSNTISKTPVSKVFPLTV